MHLKVKLTRGAQLPTLATSGSGGYDLAAMCDQPVHIAQHAVVKIPTGVAVALPAGTVGLVMARSGLGINHSVLPANGVGVIDSDYRGEILVGLTCHHPDGYTVQPQQRVAQLVITPVLTPDLHATSQLDDTERGAGRLGSTGK